MENQEIKNLIESIQNTHLILGEKLVRLERALNDPRSDGIFEKRLNQETGEYEWVHR